MRPDLAALADKVTEQMLVSPFIPDIACNDERGWHSPYSNKKDDDRWWSMFFSMLGTRQCAVVDMFFRQLTALCGQEWRADLEQWETNAGEMRACFGFIQSLKPKNVAQAALAAQLVALHIHQLRLAEGIRGYSCSDPRTAATMARLTKAFADGMLTLQKLQGKVRKSKQIIRVETHHHHHQHIHYEQTGGSPINGGQVHAADGSPAIECAALPSSDTPGQSLSIASRKGQARLPDARRRKGNRRETREG